MKIDKIMRIIIAILVFLLAVFFGQIAFAQELPDVNSTTQRVFNTDPTNVYGTLVGTLFFALVALIGLFYYVVSKFLPIWQGLINAINANSQIIEVVTDRFEDLEKHIDNRHDMLTMKLESKIDALQHNILSNIKKT